MQPSFFVCTQSKIPRPKTERVPHGDAAPLDTRRRRAVHRQWRGLWHRMPFSHK